MRTDQVEACLLGLFVLLLSACSPPPNPDGWRPTQKVAEVSPHMRPVFLLNQNDPVFLWHDGTVLHMQRLGKSAKMLPLGRTPRQWSMYPAQNDQMLLLWIDQFSPDESRLYTALIAPDLTLVRGPTQVSNANTTDYAAAVLPQGDLQALWVSRADGVVPMLYAQTVDLQGRPQPALLLARNAIHPAITINPVRDYIYTAWLEPQIGNVWSIRSGFNLSTEDISAISGSEVGLIKLKAGHVLESFVLGVDRQYLYYLWGDTDTSTGTIGSVQVLPVAPSRSLNDEPLHQFTLDGNLHWPSFPFATAIGQVLSLTAIKDGRAVPAVAHFEKGKLASLTTFPTVSGTLGATTLTSSLDQPLYLAWTVFDGSGSTGIYLTRTQ